MPNTDSWHGVTLFLVDAALKPSINKRFLLVLSLNDAGFATRQQ